MGDCKDGSAKERIILMKKLLVYLYFCFFAVLLTEVRAAAYLDPSTTTYLVQVIAGVFIAAGATAGIVWHKLKRAVRKNRPTAEVKPDEAETERDEDEAD